MGVAVPVLAVFLACLVEAVEALTIVLAAGTARGWRSAMQGVAVGLAALVAIVAAFGPALTLVPLAALQLAVGALLLVFGLGWLRKAVLRASGLKDLHDEDAIYQTQLSAARRAGYRRYAFVSDWYGFTLAFKGVLLEGLEVAFIVITFGSAQGHIGAASLAAAAAVVLVAATGLAVRGPLARIPENTMKFVVGVLLTSFGAFWATEGAGAAWPGRDVALVVLIALVLVVGALLVALLRRHTGAAVRRHMPSLESPVAAEAVKDAASQAESSAEPRAVPDAAPQAGPSTDADRRKDAAPRTSRTIAYFLRGLRAFGAFWWDFIVGDDWRIAAAVVLAIVATAGLAEAGVAVWWLTIATALGALIVSASSTARGFRHT
ncbi:MAG: hypothetical protein BGO26_14305 [Actinobacteria bacterium 69-20]|jgi:uncharacterized membrane protein|nr:MAG: hypothetical protein BGO26_14305 [Actinobacteria bacterium 69-20]